MAANKKPASLTLAFDWEKETKGTHQFKEPEQDGRPAVGSIYVTKDALADLDWSGKEDSIEVTIRVVKA